MANARILQVFQCDKTRNRSVPSGEPVALSQQAAGHCLWGGMRHLAIRAGMGGGGPEAGAPAPAELTDGNIEPPRQAIRGLGY
jgi:hypothetical protein